MHELTGFSVQAQKITDIVSEVAEQTRLLALNATIEAVHVGEYGSGFMVVATEVRKLSEQTKRSSETITGILSQIGQKADQTQAIMGHLDNDVNSANMMVHDTAREFSSILQANQKTHSEIEHIQSSSGMIVESSHSLGQAMVAALETFEANLGHVQSVQTISTNQREKIGSTLSIAKELKDISDQLNELVARLSREGQVLHNNGESPAQYPILAAAVQNSF